MLDTRRTAQDEVDSAIVGATHFVNAKPLLAKEVGNQFFKLLPGEAAEVVQSSLGRQNPMALSVAKIARETAHEAKGADEPQEDGRKRREDPKGAGPDELQTCGPDRSGHGEAQPDLGIFNPEVEDYVERGVSACHPVPMIIGNKS